jgi:hypothetical protein
MVHATLKTNIHHRNLDFLLPQSLPGGLLLVCYGKKHGGAFCKTKGRVGKCGDLPGPGGNRFPGSANLLKGPGAAIQAFIPGEDSGLLEKAAEHVTEEAAAAASNRIDEDISVE